MGDHAAKPQVDSVKPEPGERRSCRFRSRNCPESGDHPEWSGGMIVKLSRTSRWWAAGLAVTMLAALIIVFANASNHTGNGASSTLFGTLDTQTKTAATEKKDGIS